jgi:hypothetical protein
MNEYGIYVHNLMRNQHATESNVTVDKSTMLEFSNGKIRRGIGWLDFILSIGRETNQGSLEVTGTKVQKGLEPEGSFVALEDYSARSGCGVEWQSGCRRER